MYTPFRLTIFLFTAFITIISCKEKPYVEPSAGVIDNMTDEQFNQWMQKVTVIDSLNTIGNYQLEIHHLKSAINYARENNFKESLFQTYNILSLRYFQTGDFKNGELYLDSLKWTIDHFQLNYMLPHYYNSKAAQPNFKGTDSAIFYYKKALEDTAVFYNVQLMYLYANLAEEFKSKDYFNEAKYYFNKAIFLNNLDTFNVKYENNASLFKNLADIDFVLKDSVSGYKNLQRAYHDVKLYREGRGPNELYLALKEYHNFRHNTDSVLFYLNELQRNVDQSEIDELRFIPYVEYASFYLKHENYLQSNYYLDSAKKYLDANSELIKPYISKYYLTKYKVDKHTGNFEDALQYLEKARELENIDYESKKSEELKQLERSLTILRSENAIAQKEQVIQKQRFVNWSLVALSASIGFIGFSLYNWQRKKKIIQEEKNKSMRNEFLLEKAEMKMKAEEIERKRIAQEIHDDVGPAITSLKMAASIILVTNDIPTKQKATEIIKNNTTNLANQLNEIIWSLNSGNDNIQSLVSYIRKFAVNFLEQANIELKFEQQIDNHNFNLESGTRRILYQTTKEIINNAVKYAKATQLKIKIICTNNEINISIQDNGIGIVNINEKLTVGNGLNNIINNIKVIKGEVTFENNSGLNVILRVPVNGK